MSSEGIDWTSSTSESAPFAGAGTARAAVPEAPAAEELPLPSPWKAELESESEVAAESLEAIAPETYTADNLRTG